MAGDYAVLRLSPDSPPMQFLRPALGEGVVSSRHLRTMSAGATVDISGLVVCRQQPLTARGIIFLLLEEEVVEASRDIVRTAPAVRVAGCPEARAGEQRTLIAASITQFFPAEVLSMPTGKNWGQPDPGRAESST